LVEKIRKKAEKEGGFSGKNWAEVGQGLGWD
jgi:hypothetical protein